MPGHDCLSMLKALGGFMEIWRRAHALMSPAQIHLKANITCPHLNLNSL